MIPKRIKRALAKLRGRRRTDNVLARAGNVVNASVGVPPFAHASDQIRGELDRARRYEHPLAVVVLSATSAVHDPPAIEERREDARALLETRIPQLVSLVTGAVLGEALRDSDIVCYQAERNQLVVALAESNGDDARQAMQRIARLLRGRLGLDMRAGVARFPEDGLTLEDLIVHANGVWQHSPLVSQNGVGDASQVETRAVHESLVHGRKGA
jgi:hypothetical protein